MSKTIVIKLKSSGSRSTTFNITDNLGNVLDTDVSKQSLINGKVYTVEDNIVYVTLSSSSKNCCSKSWNILLSTITQPELAAIQFETKDTGSMWSHLLNTTTYNKFYGCANNYIIEYPYSYKYKDEIVQSIQDYTKVFAYLPAINGTFDVNRKIQVNDRYFDKVVIYNDEQSSGVLELVAKPTNNLSTYLTYPKYNTDSKTIIYTKSDKYYQFNSFWNIVKSPLEPLFTSTCENLSLDKEVNQDNMNYVNTSYTKYPLRGPDLRVRMIYENTDNKLISQFNIQSSQISYK